MIMMEGEGWCACERSSKFISSALRISVLDSVRTYACHNQPNKRREGGTRGEGEGVACELASVQTSCSSDGDTARLRI